MRLSDKQKLDLINSVHSPILHKKKEKLEVAQTFKFPSVVEQIDFVWNPNGTLNKMSLDDVSYSFVWTQNNSLSRITKRKL